MHPVNARHTKPFDKKCLSRLRCICEASRALIVATSTWRLKPHEFSALKKVLNAAGIRSAGGVVGATPTGVDGARGEEIQCWLRENPGAIDAGYCIIDDLDLAPNAPHHPLLAGHVVRTNGKTGLVDDDVNACIAMLQGGGAQ